MLPKLADDFAALGHALPPDDLAHVLKMSASTAGRMLRALPGPRPAKRNKRSGAAALKKSIPEMPGSQLPEAAPGACQIDSVALCGGNMAESFFHIATLTDAATQWFECAPSWNRSAAATTRAMTNIHGRLPFAVVHLHSDNGSEFINTLFLQAMEKLIPGMQLSRSRPYRKNDNCRIEQKNGSVIRDYFGDLRFDRHEHYDALEALCRDIALYTNLFRPCKKLVSKERKACKGVKYAKRYDAPRTPLERLSDFLADGDPKRLSLQRQRAALNAITLLKSIRRQLRVLARELSKPPLGGGAPPPKGGLRVPSFAPGATSRSVSTHLTDAPTS
jgi:transposase InsO family protein